MSKSKYPPSVPWNFEDELYEKLRDPEYAAFYLNEAFTDDDEVVLKCAIGSVIRANGVVKVAKKAGINRCTVSKTLKPGTRTSFKTIYSLLRACDIDLNVRPMIEAERKKPKQAVRG